jgi:hypothetical protein
MGVELQEGEMSRIMAKRGPRGKYPCILVQPIFPQIVMLYMNLPFFG